MNRLLVCSLCLLGFALFAAPTQAQVVYSTYYAPTTAYYPPVAYSSYYAPVPVTSYYAPAAPVAVSSYYAPTPVTSYYAPAPVAVAPVYAAPAVVRARYGLFRTTYRVYPY